MLVTCIQLRVAAVPAGSEKGGYTDDLSLPLKMEWKCTQVTRSPFLPLLSFAPFSTPAERARGEHIGPFRR